MLNVLAGSGFAGLDLKIRGLLLESCNGTPGGGFDPNLKGKYVPQSLPPESAL